MDKYGVDEDDAIMIEEETLVGCLGEGEFTPLIPLFPLPQTEKEI